jgi:hypothetical protein
MLFDVPYASKEINTKVFMRGQRTYQEYEEINLSLEEVCVLYDLLKLDCNLCPSIRRSWCVQAPVLRV